MIDLLHDQLERLGEFDSLDGLDELASPQSELLACEGIDAVGEILVELWGAPGGPEPGPQARPFAKSGGRHSYIVGSAFPGANGAYAPSRRRYGHRHP
jgi:hypothetical protein